MVRNYKRTTTRAAYGTGALSAALEALRDGTPVKQVSRTFGIPAKTLRRHRDGKVKTLGVSELGRHKTVFTEEYEKLLCEHIIEMERTLFGLTTFDMRRLTVDLAEKLKVKHCFSQASRMAGRDWLQSFIKRHPEISIRSPQATSLSRAVGFNRAKVNAFFDVYGTELEKGQFSAKNVWNMDESGITNVHIPSKILAMKGTRQVGKICSGERSSTVTVVCAFNAAGSYLPPLIIFPRKRMIDVLMKGSPPGSIGAASPNG
jgi:transposase-like protein